MSLYSRRYSERFKQQLIDLYLEGKPMTVLAEEYGLVEQTVYICKKFYDSFTKVDKEQSNSFKD